jgi:uncharacterized protein YaaN involved in tellurite resistance
MAGINFIEDGAYSPRLKFNTDKQMEKTPQETLQELDYKIDRLEKAIVVKNNELIQDNVLLDKLKEQRKSLMNYLNSDND